MFLIFSQIDFCSDLLGRLKITIKLILLILILLIILILILIILIIMLLLLLIILLIIIKDQYARGQQGLRD